MTLLEHYEMEREEGRKEGIMEVLHQLVEDGVLTLKDAAARAGMSEEDFRKQAQERKE